MAMQIKYTFQDISRALRFPFLAASVFPFIFGSLIGHLNFNYLLFVFGLLAVIATHLSSNLINDYFDSRSGADWQDREFYGFFGGSKLIQEGILTESWYLITSFICAILAFMCVVVISLYLKSFFPLFAYLAVIILGWQYTGMPLKLSYRGLGEVVIFLLFGPVLVMGGYFIQGGTFPDLTSFFLSLPFGFFTLAILISNEIADSADDKNAGKRTWAVLLNGGRSHLIYLLVVLSGFFAVLCSIYLKILGFFALTVLILIPESIKCWLILKNNYKNKKKLCVSSRIAIGLNVKVSLILILNLLINRLELFWRRW